MNALKSIQFKLFRKKKTALQLISFFVFAVVIFNLAIGSGAITNGTNQVVQENHIQFAASKISFIPAAHAAEVTVSNQLKSLVGNFSITNAFLWVIDWMLFVIIYAEGLLLKAAVSILDLTLNETFLKGAISSSSGTYLAWAAIRDILNLFFMMALLFSAFSTVFQVSQYHLKNFIIKLIVMALLTNFSYPITLFIIDFFNSAMIFIANVILGSGGGKPSIEFANLANLGDVFFHLMGSDIGIDRTVTLILGVIIMFMFASTVTAYAVNLYIRTVALTLLVIFSSAGFTLSFFPTTQSMSNQWWDNLIKYCLMGPVMLIVLLLTMIIFNSNNLKISESDVTAISGGSGMVGFLTSLVNFALPLITLWMGLAVTGKFGATASATAMKAIKGTGGILAHKADRFMANKTGFSVTGTKQAWKAYQARLDKAAFTPSARKMENILDATIEGAEHLATSAFPFVAGVPVVGLTRLYKGAKGYDKQIAQDRAAIAKKRNDEIERLDKNSPDYKSKLEKLERVRDDELAAFDADKGTAKKVWAGTRAGLKSVLLSPDNKARRDRDYMAGAQKAEEVSKKIGEAGNGDSNYTIDQLSKALESKEMGRKDKVQGAILRLAQDGDLNDFMKSDFVKSKYKGDGKVDYDNLDQLLTKIYRDAGVTNDEEIEKNIIRISDATKKGNNFGFAAKSHYDPKRKTFVRSTKKESIDSIVGTLRGMEPQQRQRVLRSDTMFRYSNDNDAVFSDTGLAAVGSFIGDDLTHLDKLNSDVKKRLSGIVEAYNKSGGTPHDLNTATSPEQKTEFERVNKLIEQYNQLKEVDKKNGNRNAEMYLHMAHRMQAGDDLKAARESAENYLAHKDYKKQKTSTKQGKSKMSGGEYSYSGAYTTNDSQYR